jgi:hypothetical protein
MVSTPSGNPGRSSPALPSAEDATARFTRFLPLVLGFAYLLLAGTVLPKAAAEDAGHDVMGTNPRELRIILQSDLFVDAGRGCTTEKAPRPQ